MILRWEIGVGLLSRKWHQLLRPFSDFDRSYGSTSFGLSPMRTYREKGDLFAISNNSNGVVVEEYNRTRVMRSKSAGRFDDGPVKATIPIESQYRIQPNRIDNYVPGASALSRYEEEVRESLPVERHF